MIKKLFPLFVASISVATISHANIIGSETFTYGGSGSTNMDSSASGGTGFETGYYSDAGLTTSSSALRATPYSGWTFPTNFNSEGTLTDIESARRIRHRNDSDLATYSAPVYRGLTASNVFGSGDSMYFSYMILPNGGTSTLGFGTSSTTGFGAAGNVEFRHLGVGGTLQVFVDGTRKDSDQITGFTGQTYVVGFLDHDTGSINIKAYGSGDTVSNTAEWDLTLTGETFDTYSNLMLDIDGTFAAFANIYLGETWNDVTGTAVPEPSTYALIFGLFGLGVIVRKRLKR